MYVLGIDTSTMTGGVALLQEEALVGEVVLNIRTTHSERLLPALEKLLQDGELELEEINLISVVTGPGSFTGLRIGVATAKGLSYALQKPLVGVTTLEGFGWQFAYFPGLVLPLIDARRERVFWQAFKEGQAINKPGYANLIELQSWCAERTEPILFVGDGAIAYATSLQTNFSGAVLAPTSQSLLRPSAIAHLGYKKFLAGELSDAFTLNPTYMRKTEAEMKWQEQA